MAKKTRVFHENISVEGIIANGEIGTFSQVLSSDGTKTFWADSDSGPQGYTGSQGVIGYTGSKGDIGYTGSQGITGFVGSQGDLGYTGSIGYTGSQGITGFVGSQGSQGFTGYTGSQGVPGVTAFGDGDAANPSIYFTNDTDTGLYRPSANAIAITAGGNRKAQFDSTGLTFVGNTVFGFGSDPVNYNIGIFGRSPSGGTVDWDFKTNDATYGAKTPLTITAGGSIGINTVSPTYTFDITGTMRTTGDATINGVHIVDRTSTFAYSQYNTSSVTGAQSWRVGAGIVGISNGGFSIRNTTDSINTFQLTADGNLVVENAEFPKLGVARTGIGTWYMGGTGTPGDNAFSIRVNAFEVLNFHTGGMITARFGFTSQGIIVGTAGESLRMAHATPYLSFYNAAQSSRFGYIQHDGTNVTWHNDQSGYMRINHSSGVYAQVSSGGFGVTTSLGAGTVSPDARFQAITSGSISIRMESATTSNYTNLGSALIFSRTDGAKTSAIFGINNGGLAIASREGLSFATGGAALYGAATPAMTLTSGLYAGIGTTNPLVKLQVSGGHSDSQIRLYSTGDGVGGDANIDLWASHPNVNYAGSGIGNNVNKYRYNGKRHASQGASCWEFQPDGTTQLYAASTAESTLTKKLTIDQNGFLGLNAVPSFPLDLWGVNAAGSTTVARIAKYNVAVTDWHALYINLDQDNNYVTFDSTGTNGGGFIFNSGGGEKIRMTASGAVGIGTNSPQAILDLRGDMWVRPASSSAYLHFYTPSAVPTISFCNQSYIDFLYNDVTRAAQLTSTGNMGLNCVPAYKLDVRNDNSNSLTTIARLYQYNAAVNDYHAYQIAIDPTNNWVYHYSTGNNNGGHIWGSSTERMRLTDAGVLSTTGEIIAGGNVTAQVSGYGFIQMNQSGSASYTGYISFYNYLSVRQGYIGFATTGGAISYVSESGGGHEFTGDLRCTGNITAYYSDERLKTRVKNIEHATYKVLNLNGFYYVENKLAQSFGYKGDKLHVGLSAQEVKDVLPEAVSLAPFDRDTDGKSKSGENYMTVDYAKLVPLLIESIKELHERINILENSKKL